jgi:hypothetical protein
LVRKIVDVAF